MTIRYILGHRDYILDSSPLSSYSHNAIMPIAVPKHRLFVPEAIYSDDGSLSNLKLDLAGAFHDLDKFSPSTELLAAQHLAVIYRGRGGGGRLAMDERPKSCHYRHVSNDSYAAVSTCDGQLVSRIRCCP